MKITPDTISKFDTSLFHDCALSKITCDYTNHSVQMPLLLSPYNDESVAILLLFGCTRSFEIELEEPWGEGIYVNDILITRNIPALSPTSNADIISVIITLNSGDTIKIRSETLEYLLPEERK
jgi:hypothetical protein